MCIDRKYLGEDGKVYLYRNGNWYDDKYMILPSNMSSIFGKLLTNDPFEVIEKDVNKKNNFKADYIEEIQDIDLETLLKIIDDLLKWKNYEDAVRLLSHLIDYRSIHDVKYLIPKLTSTLRKLV